MKHIIKEGPPITYLDWCLIMKGNNNEDYRALQNPEKADLHDALLKEQGFLCGYTMRRIDRTTSHIEHIKPEALCRTDEIGSDLDYYNMLSCFPRDGMKSGARYGAQEKGVWWENNGARFVSPLNPDCETLLIFNIKGEVSPSKNNLSAIKTIEVLRLDHIELTDDRRRAIEEFIYGSTGYEPLSHSEAIRAVAVIANRQFSGEFVEYCIALRYALREYISILQKIAMKGNK